MHAETATSTATGSLVASLVRDLDSGGPNKPFPVVDPSSGEIITEVPCANAEDIRTAVDTASAAQAAWADTAPRTRSEILRAAHELMLAELEPLSQLMCLEMGKISTDARAEVRYAAEFFRWFSEEAVRIGGELRTAPGGTNRILTVHRPVGVALLLTPWNFPAAMATRKIAPALAAGCTAILKPAEDTPLTALYLADLLRRAGLPDGVLHVLTTDQPGAFVTQVLDDPRIAKLSFTGSTTVGRMLLQQTANRIVNTSLELGGNAPFLVLADAELDVAVEGAMYAKMRNGGQACTAANRFLVHASLVDQFTACLSRRMGDLVLGEATANTTQLGPVVNAKRQHDIASRVSDATGDGAVLHTGGEIIDRPGFYYPATVVGNVARDSRLATEETFGPVAPIIPVEDDTDAVALANASELGLAAYVYSGDVGRALAVGSQLHSGMVGINRAAISDPAAPFGGMKQSGLGREGGFHGIYEYLEPTYLAAAW